MMDESLRVRGCLVGLAAGDAVGTTTEFLRVGGFSPVQTMVGGGRFGLLPGFWTDDTSMALCLAESLLFGSDPRALWSAWYRHGHFSSNGRCFDIGTHTKAALERFEASSSSSSSAEAAAGAKVEDELNGNGSLMRLAPTVLAFRRSSPELALQKAAEQSELTHAARNAVDSCRVWTALILGALAGASKEELLRPGPFSPVGLAADYWQKHPLTPLVDAVVQGSYRSKPSEEITNGGLAHVSLEAALWAFASTDSFEAGVLALTNKGHDADTVAAIFGQLAGAFYGIDGIPLEWRKTLVYEPFIEQLAMELGKPASSELQALFEALRELEAGHAAIISKLSPGPGPPCVWPGGYQTVAQLDADISLRVSEPFERRGPVVLNSGAGQSLLSGIQKQLAEDRRKLAEAIQRRPAVTGLLQQIRLKKGAQ